MVAAGSGSGGPSAAKAVALAVPRLAGSVAREVALFPARGWLLAERLGAASARAAEVGAAVSELVESLWEMAQNSEARIRHVENTPLGPEHTSWVLSPRVEALVASGLPPEEAQLVGASEPMVTLQTGGLLSSDEAVAIEVDVPESRLADLITRLGSLGDAGSALADQLLALPAHVLPPSGRSPESTTETAAHRRGAQPPGLD